MSNSDHQESAAARAWLCTPTVSSTQDTPTVPAQAKHKDYFSPLHSHCIEKQNLAACVPGTGVGLVLPLSPGSHDSQHSLKAPNNTKASGQTGIKLAGVRVRDTAGKDF